MKYFINLTRFVNICILYYIYINNLPITKYQLLFLLSLLHRTFFLVNWSSNKLINYGKSTFHTKISDRIVATIGELSLFIEYSRHVQIIFLIGILAEIFAWIALFTNDYYYSAKYEYQLWSLTYFLLFIFQTEFKIIHLNISFGLLIYAMFTIPIKKKMNLNIIQYNIINSICICDVTTNYQLWKPNLVWMIPIYYSSLLILYYVY